MARRTSTMDMKRRALLAAGAAVAATAAVPRVFGQQPGSGGKGAFYEKGSVRIYYEEAGSGFPLLLLPGGARRCATVSTRAHSGRAGPRRLPPSGRTLRCKPPSSL